MSWQDDPIVNSTSSSPSESSWENDPIIKEPGALESAARGAANNFPLAPQAIAGGEALLGDKSYSENLADWNQKAATAKTAHPVAYGAGAVGGAALPLVIPGVGEALEAAPVTGNALLGAANALSNKDLTKDPSGTLKDAAVGATAGGALAFGLGKILPRVEQGLGKYAQETGLKSTGIGSKVLGEMTPEELESAQKFVSEHGLVGTDKEQVLQKALEKQRELGESIGSIGKELTDRGIHASEDEILGGASKLEELSKYNKGLENPELRKMAMWHQKGANDIMNQLGSDPSWNAIQKLKMAYGKAAFTNTGEVKNEASKDVYFTLRDMLKNLTQRAQENPQLPNAYKQALTGYHTIDPVIEGLQKAVGAERAGVGGHAAGHGFLPKLIRSLPGQDHPAINLATSAAIFPFAPHLAPIMALPTFTNPAVQSKVSSSIAGKLPGIAQAATQEVLDFFTSRAVKPKNYMEKSQ